MEIFLLEYCNFRFGEATTDKQKTKIYRLRHEVYALEFGFENPEKFPDNLERDEYDDHSIHFIAVSENDDIIGTVRMILDSEKGFPIEHAANINNFKNKPALNKISEISRLAVAKQLRRRPEDGMHGVESYIPVSQGGVLDKKRPVKADLKEKRKRPAIILGLYRAIYQKCKELGISHMYMITEEKLFHALYKFGFVFSQVGDPVKYHGKRIPYATSWEIIEAHMIKHNPEILNFLLFGIDKRYYPDFLTANIQ